GGLLFRSDDSGTSYYLFSIESDGHYELSYRSSTGLKSLKRETSTAIQTGLNRPNLLTVIASGDRIALYINQHAIATITDTNRNSGFIGVFAQKSNQNTE